MAISMTLPMPPRSGPDSSLLQFFHTFEEIFAKMFRAWEKQTKRSENGLSQFKGICSSFGNESQQKK